MAPHIGEILPILIRHSYQLTATQHQIATIRAERLGIDVAVAVSQLHRAAGKALGRNFDRKRQISSADRQIGIVNRALDPNPRPMRAIVKQLGPGCADERNLQTCEQQSFVDWLHATATVTLATRRRRVRSKPHARMRNSSPKPIRLVERPSLSMTLEK